MTMALISGYHDQVRHDIVALVEPTDRLLDLGGGVGGTARAIKQMGKCHWVGLVDIVAHPADGLDFAKAADLEQPGAMEAIRNEIGLVDTILCLDVLEHLVNPAALLAEAHKALRPGGRLVASIPNVRHHSVVWPLLLGRWDYADSGVLDRTHLRFFVRKTAAALLEEAGFTILRVEASGARGRRRRVIAALTLGLFRDFVALQYYFVAKKV